MQKDFAADSEHTPFSFASLSHLATAMRVEWGKSRAHAHHYQEEIEIIKEEMN